MAENSLIIKRTYGVPNLEYCDSYVRGFEVLEDQFLLLTLTHNDSENFELKIPLNHLDIQYGRFILDYNINDDDNRYLSNLLRSIYENEGAIIEDVIDEDGIMHNVDIDAIIGYMNSISMLEMMLYFDENELIYIDLFDITFESNSKFKNKSFEDLKSYKLNFAIDVPDVDQFYKQCENCDDK